MKRITWIPIIASVVLLLIALPVFASDIVNSVQPQSETAVDAFMLDTLTDHNVFGDEFDRGESCEASGQGGIANPF